MKKLLILGAALLGLCTLGHTARAGGYDDSDYSDDRRSHERPRSYERSRDCERDDDDCAPRRSYHRVFLPPLPFFCPPPRRVVVYERPHYRRHHYYSDGYNYRPGVHIGIGF